jgi:subtilisin family serine protease
VTKTRVLRLCALAALLLLSACAGPPFVALPDNAADGDAMREHPERLIIVAVANPNDAMSTQAGSTLANYAAAQRYVAGGSARTTLAALKEDYGLRELAAWPIVALRLHCVVLEVRADVSRDALVARLARDVRVQIAQPLQTFDTLAESRAGYNDPYVDLQRGFMDVEAAQAHRVSRGGGVSVGIIDTGVDTAHADLQGRIANVRNFVDRDEAQFNRDRHGTEIAGIIAAVANNRQGIVGVAPEAKLTVYKACWQQKGSDGARCNSFTLAQALTRSIDEGTRVINLSLGGPPDELLGRLVSHALKQGSIVVGAMPADGNASGFPAGIPGVIVVEAAGRQRARRDALQAPGRDILTLEPGGHYDFDSGSSLAAAHVSATIALLLSVNPKLDAAAVRLLLERSQTPTGIGASISACAALAGLGQPVTCGAREAALLH